MYIYFYLNFKYKFYLSYLKNIVKFFFFPYSNINKIEVSIIVSV